MRKQPTAAQKAAAEARRDSFRALVKQVSKMTDAADAGDRSAGGGVNSATFTLADFERWLAQLARTGFLPTNEKEIERIRGILRAGGTMTAPVRDGAR